MHKLKIKYLKAQNFLCFGEEGIEINFQEYGNIVCVKGKNLDVNSSDGKSASNGSGKTTLADLVVYALYGQTIKNPKKLSHTDLINKFGKKLTVEIIWDKYRIVRTRNNKNVGTLQLWESEEGVWDKNTEISVGGLPTTQKEIEKKIGLSYQSFINIFIFSDDNTIPFLECDTGVRREIVENYLSLNKYAGYFENANKMLKEVKSSVKDLTKEYEFLKNQKDTITNSIAQIEKQEQSWYESKKRELGSLLNEIKKKRDELDLTKTGSALASYNEAQEEIKALNEKLPVLEDSKKKVGDFLEQIKAKKTEVVDKRESLKIVVEGEKRNLDVKTQLLKENQKIANDVMNKVGKECPYCLSLVEEERFGEVLSKANKTIDEIKPLHEALTASYQAKAKDLESLSQIIQTVDKKIAECNNKISAISYEITEIHCRISKLSKVEAPNASLAEVILSEQIESLKTQVVNKQNELNGETPFQKIKATAVENLTNKIKDCKEKEEQIKKLEGEVPYYEFWVKAFSDNGIRKYIIDGIIPILNSQVEYWLQFLIENKIKLVFDNTLNVKIDRYPFTGKDYVYFGMSGGQRRRLNLAVAAAWAFVSALNSGASPSLIFLDEVTMNMDEVGIVGIYKMICELAKDKQVFIIDHNESLLEMLDGCNVITLEMKDEVSRKLA